MHSRMIWRMSVVRAGQRQVVARHLERDVRVVIRVVGRMRQPEERCVAVLVERVLDRVGPDGGIRQRSWGRRTLRTSASAGVLQVDFGGNVR